jgi:hypothetical protein
MLHAREEPWEPVAGAHVGQEHKFKLNEHRKPLDDNDRVEYYSAMSADAKNIPNWAVFTAILGVLFAVAGFVSAWFTPSGFATLGLTVGLLLMALGMNAAEHAINATPKK